MNEEKRTMDLYNAFNNAEGNEVCTAICMLDIRTHALLASLSSETLYNRIKDKIAEEMLS